MKNDTHWIITYCHSIVNIARVSYRNCYYLYYRDIKQQKGKLVVIAHWPTMIILLYIWFILNCNGNFSHKYWICGIFNILCHNFLKRSNKSINFDFDQQQQVHNTKLLLPQLSEHWNMEKYRGSDERGEVYIGSYVNHLASGNLRQSTTVPSQCDWST